MLAPLAPLFELLNGVLLPCLPSAHHDSDSPQLSLDEAAIATGLPAEELRNAYHRFLCGVMSPEAAARAAKSKGKAKPRYRVGEEEALKLLRQNRYGHLSDEHYSLMLALCERRGLSVWHEHTWAEVRHNEAAGRPELYVGTTAAGLLELAAATGEYAGVGSREWCGTDYRWRDVWLDEVLPMAARVAVRRRSGEVELAVATWDSYAPWRFGDRGERVYAASWRKMPDVMLAKCAMCLALRQAFPKLCGVYSREEMMQAARPAGTRVAVGELAATGDDGEAPYTVMMLHLALIDFGFKDQAHRARLIGELRKRFAELEEPEFCRAAYRLVRSNPERYGGAAPKLA